VLRCPPTILSEAEIAGERSVSDNDNEALPGLHTAVHDNVGTRHVRAFRRG
jgi:hypothetical protein